MKSSASPIAEANESVTIIPSSVLSPKVHRPARTDNGRKTENVKKPVTTVDGKGIAMREPEIIVAKELSAIDNAGWSVVTSRKKKTSNRWYLMRGCRP